MKKWIAVLMACLMLLTPVLSLAEEAALPDTYTVDYAITMDAEAVEQWLAGLMKDMGADVDQSTAVAIHSTITAAAAIYNATTLRIRQQPDGFYCALLMQDEEILTLQADMHEDRLTLTTNLLPDYVLEIPFGDVKLSELSQRLEAMDWQGLGDALWQTCTQWYASMRPTTEYGSFMGDAYEGGTRRESIALDDRDVAVLVDGLSMALEQREDAMALLDAAFGEGRGKEWMAQLRAYDHEVALKNEYHYTASMVYTDKSTTPMGISFTAMVEDVTLGTLSVGLEEDGCNVVLGALSGSDMMYSGFGLSVTGDAENLTMKAQMSSSVGDAGQGYDAAKPTMTMDFTEQYALTEKGMTVMLDASSAVVLESMPHALNMTMTGTGEVTYSPYSMSAGIEVTPDDGDKPLYTVSESGKASEPFAAADTEGKTVLDITSLSAEEEDALRAAAQDGAETLMIEVFRHVPAEAMAAVIQMVNTITQNLTPHYMN